MPAKGNESTESKNLFLKGKCELSWLGFSRRFRLKGKQPTKTTPRFFSCFTQNPGRESTMKKGLLSWIIFLASFTAWAQNSLSGKIYDAKTLIPLVGASVWIESLGKVAVTDSDGKFTLARVPNGKQEIRVSYVGYETVRKSVELPLAASLELGLESKDFLSEEFIVSATRASESTPTTFTTVDKSEIAKRNLGQDIPVLLNFSPSVVSHSDAGAGVGYTGIRIRGTDQTQIGRAHV